MLCGSTFATVDPSISSRIATRASWSRRRPTSFKRCFVEELWKAEGAVARTLPERLWEEVLSEVSQKGEVAREQILGRVRERRASRARCEFLVRAHEEARLSAAQLSRICKISHVSVRQALLKGVPQEEGTRQPTSYMPADVPGTDDTT